MEFLRRFLPNSDRPVLVRSDSSTSVEEQTEITRNRDTIWNAVREGNVESVIVCFSFFEFNI